MSKDEKKPLGRILLTRKLVSKEALDAALTEQQEGPDKKLASILTDHGDVSEPDALRALSEQFGVPAIDMGQIVILLEHLEVMPRELAEAHKMLPVLVRGDRLFVAMAKPSDKRVIEELEFVSGKKVYAYVALTGPLDRTIAGAYDAKSRGEVHFLGPHVPAETLARMDVKAPVDPFDDSRRVDNNAPEVIVDEDMAAVGRAADMSIPEFGELTTEISTVTELAPDLRGSLGILPVASAADASDGAPASQEGTEPAVAGAAGGQKTILLVDDEEDIRRLLSRVFSEMGHRVLEANRGLVALRMVKQFVPDLIVLDAMLPELHGFDIARRIKGSAKYGGIPIIMISAAYRGWRIAEDLKASYGIHTYIEKPFRIVDVTKAVAYALNLRLPGGEHEVEAVSAEAEKCLERGIAAYREGQLDQAIEHLARGVNIDPLAYRLRFHLALLHGKKGNIYEGIQELEKAIEIHPKHFPALKNLAVLYEKAGFRHKAVEAWERCVANAPDPETRTKVKEHLMSLL